MAMFRMAPLKIGNPTQFITGRRSRKDWHVIGGFRVLRHLGGAIYEKMLGPTEA
jgi:hypothetical protein